MIQYIDGDAWSSVGIDDPEQFIDRYCMINTANVVSASFKVERRPAVTGFTNLDELRSIVFRYTEFRKARDVGIELPNPRVYRCELDLDQEQAQKYEEFVQEIEASLKARKAQSVLGKLARLGLVALHPKLDEGYSWKTRDGGEATRRVGPKAVSQWARAGWEVVTGEDQGDDDGDVLMKGTLEAVDPSSPKFRAVAQRVAAQPTCGHIVFCEPTAAQSWLRDVLVDYGIPTERIAIINADVAKAAERFKIARAFNGDDGEPRYDVVIANSVANEGIDLQTRTCAIHHVDIPWTPADLEQRNGRGHRQGNQNVTIGIYYYLARGSMDLFRFDLIRGKAGWIDDLVAGNPETSNPAAQTELSPEEMLIALSGDPARTRKLLAAKREEDERQKIRVAREAGNRRLLRVSSTSRKLAGLAKDDPKAKAIAEELTADVTKLRKIRPELWPFAALIEPAQRRELIATSVTGMPVYEGMRLRLLAGIQGAEERPLAEGWSGLVEVGKPLGDGLMIAVRQAGESRWRRKTLEELGNDIDARSLLESDAWPQQDTARMISDAQGLLSRQSLLKTLTTDFEGASDGFRAALWPALGDRFLAAAVKERLPVPAVVDGALALVEGPTPEGAEFLPWTVTGFERAEALGRPKKLPWGELNKASQLWWGRPFPKGVVDETTPETPANPADTVTPEEGTPTPAPALAQDGPVWEGDEDPLLAAARKRKRRAMAQSSEGYVDLLGGLEELAQLDDPMTLAFQFPEEGGIRELIVEYVNQERSGRKVTTDGGHPWEIREFVTELREKFADTIPADGTVLARGGGLVVRPTALRGSAEDGWYVLRQDTAGASRRYVALKGEFDLMAREIGIENVEDPRNQGKSLASGDDLYVDSPDLDDARVTGLWRVYRRLIEVLHAAPQALEQSRQTILYARELADRPLCQGRAREEAMKAIKGAMDEYFKASERVQEGAFGAAYTNLRRLTRYIALQAQQLAESCALGQTALGVGVMLDPSNVGEAQKRVGDRHFAADEAQYTGEDVDEYDDVDEDDA
jgi:superfamily II DNA or RNA helicase